MQEAIQVERRSDYEDRKVDDEGWASIDPRLRRSGSWDRFFWVEALGKDRSTFQKIAIRGSRVWGEEGGQESIHVLERSFCEDRMFLVLGRIGISGSLARLIFGIGIWGSLEQLGEDRKKRIAFLWLRRSQEKDRMMLGSRGSKKRDRFLDEGSRIGKRRSVDGWRMKDRFLGIAIFEDRSFGGWTLSHHNHARSPPSTSSMLHILLSSGSIDSNQIETIWEQLEGLPMCWYELEHNSSEKQRQRPCRWSLGVLGVMDLERMNRWERSDPIVAIFGKSSRLKSMLCGSSFWRGIGSSLRSF